MRMMVLFTLMMRKIFEKKFEFKLVLWSDMHESGRGGILNSRQKFICKYRVEK